MVMLCNNHTFKPILGLNSPHEGNICIVINIFMYMMGGVPFRLLSLYSLKTLGGECKTPTTPYISES